VPFPKYGALKLKKLACYAFSGLVVVAIHAVCKLLRERTLYLAAAHRSGYTPALGPTLRVRRTIVGFVPATMFKLPAIH